MGLSPDTVSNIIYVFGVSCAIPCAFFLLDCELKTCVQHFFPPCLYGLLSLYFILRSMIPSMSTPILER